MNEGGVVIGMLSEKDVRAAVGHPIDFMRERATPVAPARPRVGEAMFQPAVTASEDAPVAQLAYLFADRWLGALPIVDAEGKLLGILSYVDVLRSLARALGADAGSASGG